MPVPSEGHEGIGENEKKYGVKRPHETNLRSLFFLELHYYYGQVYGQDTCRRIDFQHIVHD